MHHPFTNEFKAAFYEYTIFLNSFGNFANKLFIIIDLNSELGRI
jgi:hypothetical protein